MSSASVIPELTSDTSSQRVDDYVLPQGFARAGRLGSLVRTLRFVLNPLSTVAGRFGRFGDAYRVAGQGGDLFSFRHPDHIKDILVSQPAVFGKQHSAFRTLSVVLGDALLTSDGDRWRRQRRLVQPAFSRSRLQQYSSVMVEEALAAVQTLAHGQRSVDLSRELNALTLRIVTRALFGQAAGDTARTGAAMQEVNRWFGSRGFFMNFIPGAVKRFRRAHAALNDDIDRLVTARRQTLDADADAPDLLAALMLARDEDGAALDARELRDQLLTLYVAGHETTSHALTWTFYLLSRHPDALALLREELASVIGDRPPRFEDIPALVYTEQVLKEALRMYPPAYVIPRRITSDAQVGPYKLPKDSDVMVWTYMTHHDPRFYPEPQRFRPERFSPEQEKQRPKYAYLPFGAGQRACIGQQFAMLEAQLVLATLVPRLDFRYARLRRPSLQTAVTLQPRGGLPMQVKSR